MNLVVCGTGGWPEGKENGCFVGIAGDIRSCYGPDVFFYRKGFGTGVNLGPVRECVDRFESDSEASDFIDFLGTFVDSTDATKGLVILLYRSRSRRGTGGGEKGSRQAVPV